MDRWWINLVRNFSWGWHSSLSSLAEAEISLKWCAISRIFFFKNFMKGPYLLLRTRHHSFLQLRWHRSRSPYDYWRLKYLLFFGKIRHRQLWSIYVKKKTPLIKIKFFFHESWSIISANIIGIMKLTTTPLSLIGVTLESSKWYHLPSSLFLP